MQSRINFTDRDRVARNRIVMHFDRLTLARCLDKSLKGSLLVVVARPGFDADDVTDGVQFLAQSGRKSPGQLVEALTR